MAAFMKIDAVCHVGSMDVANKTNRSSLEAMMLSVSVDPEEWASIARCGGPEWTLNREGAEYLDAHSLSDDEMDDIRIWAVEKGYAEEKDIWRAWSFDSESEDWRYMQFETKEAAEYEVEDDIDEDVKCEQTEDGHPVEKVSKMVLTDAGMSALERWQDKLSGDEGIVILWAREEMLPLHDNMVGIWWPEIHSPEDLSCPRGGIFPERLELMDISRGWYPEDSYSFDTLGMST